MPSKNLFPTLQNQQKAYFSPKISTKTKKTGKNPSFLQ